MLDAYADDVTPEDVAGHLGMSTARHAMVRLRLASIVRDWERGELSRESDFS